MDYEEFVRKVEKLINLDLSQYKQTQMRRRIESMKNFFKAATYDEFYQMLLNDKKVFEKFFDKITINVSEFFRNPDKFQILKDHILPEILSRTSLPKIWSAGCSTGEEPYSIAILLEELKPNNRIIIDATDFDDKILKKAQEGVYPPESVANVPKEYLEKYFTFDGEKYRISPKIKAKVRFKKGNLLHDPFPKEYYDLIVCRNVVIYFTDEAKDKLFTKFGEALKKGGYLFIGSTERIFKPQKYGLSTTKFFFFYQKVSNPKK